MPTDTDHTEQMQTGRTE